MNEVFEFIGDGGGVRDARGLSLHDQLQLLEDVHVFGERVGEFPNGQFVL